MVTASALRRACRVAAVVLVAWVGGARPASAQLGSLISPGRLTKAHASLEGLGNCKQCHEQGQKVTAAKCLVCHQPIAQRIAARRGVHRDAGGGCVSCHVEHTGADGELRPFDTKQFDHARVTGFPLEGKHAPGAVECSACHKTRSFVQANPSCVSCHADVHKGSLGRNCASCHSTKAAFKQLGGQFDHTRAAFQLVGAHRSVACTACHVNGQFKGIRFAACTDCHKDPHRQTFGATCTSCHTSETWRTKKVDHSRTAFPLSGRHVAVDCAACHRQSPMKVKARSDTCAVCHADIHRGAFKQDCKACHTESGFQKAPFDHSKTAFTLTGQHAALACARCHTTVVTTNVPAAKRVAEFRGLKSACAACHRDVHAGSLGAACESCHSSASFKGAAYVHPRFHQFFAGRHEGVACVRCHSPGTPADRPSVRAAANPTPSALTFKAVPTACATCHKDVHNGQLGAACERCHTVDAAKFAAAAFAHQQSRFALTGKHTAVLCEQCHKPESTATAAAAAATVRFKGVPTECRGCHEDVHLGQVANTCDACHATSSFKVARYVHQGRGLVASGFFVGRHATPSCQSCHKRVTSTFPAGRGTAVLFKVDARCAACHTDVHRGALGDRCIDCHKP